MATTVTYHADGYAAARPAINVKAHIAGIEYWPDGLEGPLDSDRAANIVETAYDRVQSDFWQAAEEIAVQRGLGAIEQEGRSGGWLVFTEFDLTRLQEEHDAGFHFGDIVGACSTCDPEGLSEWLAAYTAMTEWADAFIAAAPAKVRDLAQQLAMDEVGHGAAERMFGHG